VVLLDGAAPDGGPDAGDDGRRRPPEDWDVLFVIDNSPRMAEHQANLARKLPMLINELKRIPGGLPNLHLGVITGDLGAGSTPTADCRLGGDGGVLRTNATCGPEAGARFLSAFENGTRNNFPGDISDAFACLAQVGSGGCRYQHPLEALRAALSEARTPQNKGFLRADAKLLIVLVTNQDDCSASATSDLFAGNPSFAGTTAALRCAQVGHLCNGKAPPIAPFTAPLDQCTAAEGGPLLGVSAIADFVRSLKDRPDTQILVSAIAGSPFAVPAPSYRYGMAPGGTELDYLPLCTSPSGSGAPALRLARFLEAFGTFGVLTSICGDRFGEAVAMVGQRF